MSIKLGDFQSSLDVPADHAIRVNSAGNAVETFNTSTLGGISIGDAIGGSPDANGILFADGSGNLATDSKITFNSGDMDVEGQIIVRYGASTYCEIDLDVDSRLVIGNATYADRIPQVEIKYTETTGGYGSSGLMLNRYGYAYKTVLNSIGQGKLFITDASGGAGELVLGTRSNPTDGSRFIAGYNTWYMPDITSKFAVGTSLGGGQISSLSASIPQFCAYYDVSNYATIQVSSVGLTTFEAVGSGAGFKFNDPITLADGKDILINATTGSKIGQAASKIGFFGNTPVAQQNTLTAQLSTITHTAPSTPDYALQDLTLSGYGFATKDEGNSLLKVVENLQVRVAEIETRQQNLGLIK